MQETEKKHCIIANPPSKHHLSFITLFNFNKVTSLPFQLQYFSWKKKKGKQNKPRNMANYRT